MKWKYQTDTVTAAAFKTTIVTIARQDHKWLPYIRLSQWHKVKSSQVKSSFPKVRGYDSFGPHHFSAKLWRFSRSHPTHSALLAFSNRRSTVPTLHGFHFVRSHFLRADPLTYDGGWPPVSKPVLASSHFTYGSPMSIACASYLSQYQIGPRLIVQQGRHPDPNPPPPRG